MGPDVEAAFVGDGGGEFADHQRGGEAPEDGDDGEQKERAAEAGHADDVLEAVGAAGDHEVDGGDERKETKAGGARLAGAGDWCGLLCWLECVSLMWKLPCTAGWSRFVGGVRSWDSANLREACILFETQTIPWV